MTEPTRTIICKLLRLRIDEAASILLKVAAPDLIADWCAELATCRLALAEMENLP